MAEISRKVAQKLVATIACLLPPDTSSCQVALHSCCLKGEWYLILRNLFLYIIWKVVNVDWLIILYWLHTLSTLLQQTVSLWKWNHVYVSAFSTRNRSCFFFDLHSWAIILVNSKHPHSCGSCGTNCLNFFWKQIFQNVRFQNVRFLPLSKSELYFFLYCTLQKLTSI